MLFKKIGKYKIYKDKTSFKIRYLYSLTDFIGILWYLISLVTGGILFAVAIYEFNFEDITNWLILLTGLALILFSIIMVIMGLYNPYDGILQIRHDINKVIIRDLFKKKVIDIDDIIGFYYEIKIVYKPKQHYAVIYLKAYSKERINCFIIRSHYSIDITRAIEKELHQISRTICKTISEELHS